MLESDSLSWTFGENKSTATEIGLQEEESDVLYGGAVVLLGSSLSTPPPDVAGVNVLGLSLLMPFDPPGPPSSLEWFPLGPPGPPF